jgi:membrane associated rhomboid family serine protease
MFNVPPVILWLSATMAFIHGVRAFLTSDQNLQLLLWFAFIPARYDAAETTQVAFPGGIAADIWTFVSYSFLHAEIMHLAVNLIWFLAFGSAVAWRFGAARFLAFYAVTAAAGAAVYLLMHAGEFAPVIGASAAISGAMAAATRFVFADGGPLGFMRGRDIAAYRQPAPPLWQSLKNRRVFTFLLVWFLLNFLFGLSAVSSALTESSIAWEAHAGGFLAGLLLFRFFDPVPTTVPGVPLAPTGEDEEP